MSIVFYDSFEYDYYIYRAGRVNGWSVLGDCNPHANDSNLWQKGSLYTSFSSHIQRDIPVLSNNIMTIGFIAPLFDSPNMTNPFLTLRNTISDQHIISFYVKSKKEIVLKIFDKEYSMFQSEIDIASGNWMSFEFQFKFGVGGYVKIRMNNSHEYTVNRDLTDAVDSIRMYNGGSSYRDHFYIATGDDTFYGVVYPKKPTRTLIEDTGYQPYNTSSSNLAVLDGLGRTDTYYSSNWIYTKDATSKFTLKLQKPNDILGYSVCYRWRNVDPIIRHNLSFRIGDTLETIREHKQVSAGQNYRYAENFYVPMTEFDVNGAETVFGISVGDKADNNPKE